MENHNDHQDRASSNMTVEQYYLMCMRIVHYILSIVTMPVEYALRPFFSTRYFDPLQLVAAYALTMVLSIVGFAASKMPFSDSFHISDGLFGMGTIALLFFAANFIHGPRLWRRMFYMELEEHSQFEGDALPFFSQLPWGDSFWIVRIVWEPVFVFSAAISMRVMFILDTPAMVYLMVCAVMLGVKSFISWYQSWLHLRILMDARFAGPLVAKAAAGKATERELASIHMAGFAGSVPNEVRTAAISKMLPKVPALPAEIASLISPVEVETPKAA